MSRDATVKRKTKETDIVLELNLDGRGKAEIDTGIPFLDHMLTLLAAHGFMDIQIGAQGDTDVDHHHTVEDIGICLGTAIKKALGEKRGIRRYGEAVVPMDEALARVVIDISNRPYLAYRGSPKQSVTGNFDVHLLKEFFRAVVNNAGLTLHVDILSGEDAHHVAEVIFKAFGRAMDGATSLETRQKDSVPSTKGMI